MEKPRKLHVMEGLIDNSNVLSNRELSRKVRNDTIDAMSTWLEGEVPSAKEIYDDLYSSTSLPGYFISDERAKSVILLISQRIHKNLTRKLKGEV